MKHNIKITAILLVMFLVTQLIGLYVVNFYSPVKVVDGVSQNISAQELPLGMQPPEIKDDSEYQSYFIAIFIAFVIAISLLILLTKFNAAFILKIWFLVVVAIALTISFNSILSQFKYTLVIALTISIIFAFAKIYQRNFLIHNFTELFIYPGIAAVFVPILNMWTIVILLILISIYDMWAVWHSGIMQKMAKYQIDNLKIFSGFFIPYVSKKIKLQIQKLKQTTKGKKQLEKKKFGANVAILGGGDVIFPIITAGVAMKKFGFTTIGIFQIPIVSFFIILGAMAGLGYLFFFAEKKKFYPAMPYISAGIFAGMLASYFLF